MFLLLIFAAAFLESTIDVMRAVMIDVISDVTIDVTYDCIL